MCITRLHLFMGTPRALCAETPPLLLYQLLLLKHLMILFFSVLQEKKKHRQMLSPRGRRGTEDLLQRCCSACKLAFFSTERCD